MHAVSLDHPADPGGYAVQDLLFGRSVCGGAWWVSFRSGGHPWWWHTWFCGGLRQRAANGIVARIAGNLLRHFRLDHLGHPALPNADCASSADFEPSDGRGAVPETRRQRAAASPQEQGDDRARGAQTVALPAA